MRTLRTKTTVTTWNTKTTTSARRASISKTEHGAGYSNEEKQPATANVADITTTKHHNINLPTYEKRPLQTNRLPKVRQVLRQGGLSARTDKEISETHGSVPDGAQ